ncbi:MAG TPA: NIPSNAP family protein [Flavitalea sp.]|nr:NIPSNAP family protein [Flavitalea sp.]
MKRRSFVKASLLTGSLSGLAPIAGLASGNSQGQKKSSSEFYELRTYSLKNEAHQKLVEDYFKNAAIPALNRLGSRSIGVFRELKPTEAIKLYVLIPFPSLGDFLRVQESLSKDAAYNQAGSAYLNAPATEPAYERIESSLFRAFSTMPKIEVPEKKSRIFELRRYESSGEMAGKKKIEMFDKGEIEIFRKVGLTPVFFGEALIGTFRPNLTYMLTFDDMDEHDRNWKTFGSDPDWKRISGMPEYADAKIVSRITRVFLSPTDFSQV